MLGTSSGLWGMNDIFPTQRNQTIFKIAIHRLRIAVSLPVLKRTSSTRE